MKRYYAHYTFIYPDTLLKNHVVEIDLQGCISRCFAYTNELANTEYHSGLQVFIPVDLVNRVEVADLLEAYPQLLPFVPDALVRGFFV